MLASSTTWDLVTYIGQFLHNSTIDLIIIIIKSMNSTLIIAPYLSVCYTKLPKKHVCTKSVTYDIHHY